MDMGHREVEPQFELPKDPRGEERRQELQVEQKALPNDESSPSGSLSDSGSIPPPVALDPSQFAQPAAQLNPNDPNDPASQSAMMADDSDLIEKHWVDRAKAVVARTQDNPYAQKSELSKVKAEYIQKRYNKTIITDDSSSS